MQNLIGNAIKYKSQHPPLIEISCKNDPNEWIFEVRDNGIGIEVDYQQIIFNMFQRLHSRSKFSGTGIGLAICKKIVELHGGQISVESAPDKGSTFRFTLPKSK